MAEITGYIQKITFFLFMMSILMECVKGMKCEKYVRSVLSLFLVLMVIEPVEAIAGGQAIDDAVRYFSHEMEQSAFSSQIRSADDVTKDLLIQEMELKIQEEISESGEELGISVKDTDLSLSETGTQEFSLDSVHVNGDYYGSGNLSDAGLQFQERIAAQFGIDTAAIEVTLKGGED